MDINIPNFFQILLSETRLQKADIIKTKDGFFLLYKSLSSILAEKNIVDFPGTNGERLSCDKFFDDWFLYAVPNDKDYTYSLLKMREQEYDAANDWPADGDTPGVTVSFISFDCNILLSCLAVPDDKKREKLSNEIGRVVSSKGQRHHKAIKEYFKNPKSQAPYLISTLYTKHIAAFANDGCLAVPDCYKKTVQLSELYKNSAKFARLPLFIESLNKAAGRIVCDNEKIYIRDREIPDEYESLAILATHTANTSVYSFAAEVEYHARFLVPLAKIKIPFIRKSIYESAIRADMTIGDTEFEGPAPFYKPESKIVKRQYNLHHKTKENYYD